MCLSGVQRAKNSTDHSRSNKITVCLSHISPSPSFFILVIHSVFFLLTYHLLIFYSNLLSLSDSVSSFIFFFLYLCCRSRNHSLLLAFISTSSISFLPPLPPSFLSPPSPPPFLPPLRPPPLPRPPTPHPSASSSLISSFFSSALSLSPPLCCFFTKPRSQFPFLHPLPFPSFLFPKSFHLQVCNQCFGAGRMWPSGCDGQRRSSPCGQSPAALSRWTAKLCCCSPRRTSATDPPTPVRFPAPHEFLWDIRGVFQAGETEDISEKFYKWVIFIDCMRHVFLVRLEQDPDWKTRFTN